MRDLPGFYFDPERNRYFKITQGGPTNISTASSSTTRQYPQYTVNSIKNSKKANKKQKLDILLSRKRQLIIKDKLNIPFNNVSGLQGILWGRRKMDVKINAIGFNELFLKPQMGSMFKKKVSFHGNNLEAKCSLSVGKYVIIGTASGKVKIIKFDNPNIDLEKETKINVQSNTLYSDLSQITSLKLIKNNLAFTSLGEAKITGKFHLIKGFNDFMTGLGSIQQPFSYKDDSSIWCMEAINNNNFILGCSNGIKLLDLDHSITNQTKSHKISKKDTRSLSLLNDNPSLFLSGSRDGIVHLYDLRQKKKTFNRGIIKYDHLVNQIEKYNTYNILCSSVKSGIFMHDYRMIKGNNSELKIIKEFNGYSNEYLYDLKFMIHKDTNTLICGGTDNKLRFWSLIDELSTREPICEFNAPVKQLIPYEYYNSFNQCSKPSFLANYNNNWDLFSL